MAFWARNGEQASHVLPFHLFPHWFCLILRLILLHGQLFASACNLRLRKRMNFATELLLLSAAISHHLVYTTQRHSLKACRKFLQQALPHWKQIVVQAWTCLCCVAFHTILLIFSHLLIQKCNLLRQWLCRNDFVELGKPCSRPVLEVIYSLSIYN